ncbi:hypothetical protein AX16_010703 [Volvariella volvacea WC 439]|nr:hypothetical protein AX16_010703 [Volvariella volvacea WC 439]
MPAALRTTHSKAEAKYNVQTEFPSLGLHAAAASGNLGLVEFALDHGQPVNSVLDGVLPLHAASAGGNAQVVRVLIAHGADVNAPRLPRRYSNDRNRDSSTPIIGTSGSTPLHFAAANGNLSVITTLLQNGAHADRPDKHGVTPEMLARQNGWLECAQVLHDWALNKDKDLRERELPYYPPVEPDPIPSTRKRLQVKRSIDTAFNMLKSSSTGLSEAYLKPVQATSSSIAVNSKISTSTPPASPFQSLGEFPQSRRSGDGRSSPYVSSHQISLSQINHSSASNSARSCKITALADPPVVSHRPRSAGTDADREVEPDASTVSRRRLGTKYSLLNLFKKAQTSDTASGSVGELDVANSNTDDFLGSPSIPIPTPNSPPHPSSSVYVIPLSSSPQLHPDHPTPAVDSNEKLSQATLSPPTTSVSPLSRGPFRLHRESDASTRSHNPVPHTASPTNHAHSTSKRDRSRSASSGHRFGFSHENEGTHSTNSLPSSTSPFSRLNLLRSRGHRRDRSGSGGSLDAMIAQTQPSGHRARSSLDGSTGGRASLELSPSPAKHGSLRPGILRLHHKTSSSSGSNQMSQPFGSAQSQDASPGVRSLRFDESSSPNFVGRKEDEGSFGRSDAPLRSSRSVGSFIGTTLDLDVGADTAQTEPDSAPPILNNFVVSSAGQNTRISVEDDEDAEVDYGQPVALPRFGGITTEARSALMSTPIPIIASSSKASLSPIEEPGSDDTSGANALASQFPFHRNQQPAIETARDRGDSLSSMATTNTADSRTYHIGSTSTGGGSLTATTPSRSPVLALHEKGQDLSASKRELSSRWDEKSTSSPINITPSLGERRSHVPLDIDISAISSHAQAEALVQRTKQEILDMDVAELTGGAGRTPLSALLASYGETLELERRLREKEQREREEAAQKEEQRRELGGTTTTMVQRRPSVESGLNRRPSRLAASRLARDGAIPEVPSTGASPDDDEPIDMEKVHNLGHSRSMTRVRPKVPDLKRPSTSEGLSRQANTSFGSDHTSPSPRSTTSPFIPAHRSKLSLEHDSPSSPGFSPPPVVRAQSSLGTHSIRHQYSSSYLRPHEHKNRHLRPEDFPFDSDEDDLQSADSMDDEFGHPLARSSTTPGLTPSTSLGTPSKKGSSGLQSTLAASSHDRDKRTVKKLTKMGFAPAAELATKGRMPTPLPVTVSAMGQSGHGGRFGAIKSFFKGGK